MKIAVVTTVLDEADIIGDTLTHLYNEGIANVYVVDGMSTDGTRDILAQFPVKMYDDDCGYHRQPYWTTRLAQQAYEDGADWVLCTDSDEFWYARGGATIAETLAALPDDVGALGAQMWQHLDYDYREPNPKPLMKVAFRAANGVRVANGNHDAFGWQGKADLDVLALREVQYRGFDHFCHKIEQRCATLDPSLPPGEGTHHTQYRGWSKERLLPVWEAMVARATVYDPIPVRVNR